MSDILPWFGAINVKAFGAQGNGVTDDTAAVQRVIDELPHLVGGRRPIWFPAGHYIFNSGLTLPVSIQGIELFGTGWTETDTSATVLINQSTMPLFRTTGTGTCAFLKVHDMRLMQGANAGYFFQFDNLTVHADIGRIHCNMSNTGAGVILMNGVENHMNWIHDIKSVGSGMTVPMYHWDSPKSSNMTTTKFERLTTNTPGSTTAPQILIDHKLSSPASTGFKFEQLNIEQPNGGGVHLYGIGGAIFENCISGDTASQTEPVYLFDRHLNDQSELEITMTQCKSYIGTELVPDLEVRNTPGTPGVVGPIRLDGCRFNSVKSAAFSVIHRDNGKIGFYDIPAGHEPAGWFQGSIIGLRGLGKTHNPVGTEKARNFSGVAAFQGMGKKVTVQLNQQDPEANTDYEVHITPFAGERMHVDRSSKTTTTFDVITDKGNSTAEFLWTLVRP